MSELNNHIFITNLNYTIAQEYKKILTEAYNNFGVLDIYITTGYFNLYGWELLIDALEGIEYKIKILIGKEPEDNFPETKIIELQSILSNKILQELNTLEIEKYEHIIRFCEWLQQGYDNQNVEIKIYTENFLHAKTMFIETEKTFFALVGSANLTYSGLSKNNEALLAIKEINNKIPFMTWYKHLWEKESNIDFTLKLRQEYYRKVDVNNPESIYYNIVGKHLDQGLEYEPVLDKDKWLDGLTEYQEDAVIRADRILQKQKGILIADEVGLGKTYIAGALIKKAILLEGKDVLVVSPASINNSVWDKWVKNIPHSKVRRNTHYLSYNIAAKYNHGDEKINELKEHSRGFTITDYGLIIYDEAHYLKSDSTTRYKVLERIAQENPNSKIVLLTATPINNSILDIYNIFKIFIPSLEIDYFDIFKDKNKAITRSDNPVEPKNIDWIWLWNLLDKNSIKRTRTFIKENYPTIKIGNKILTFPSAEVKRLEYEIPEPVITLLDKISNAYQEKINEDKIDVLIKNNRLSLAAYDIHPYLKEEYRSDFYRTPVTGLIFTLLMKRIDSSIPALRKTLETMKNQTKKALNNLDKQKNEEATIEDPVDKEDEFQDNDKYKIDREGKISTSKIDFNKHIAFEYKEKYRKDLENDIKIFSEWQKQLNPDSSMPLEKHFNQNYKEEALLQKINKILSTAKNEDERKIIIFTSYLDTANNIKEFLEKCQNLHIDKDRVTLVSGSTSPNDKETILTNFAPKTFPAEPQNEAGLYDILIATDVLAEGVNLQQAANIINYDLPWNPVKVTQRIGRIDRLFSEHKKVYGYCMIPADSVLEKYLSLYDKIRQKAKTNQVSHGGKDYTTYGYSEDETLTFRSVFGYDQKTDESEQIQQIAEDKFNPEQFDGFDINVSYKKYETIMKNNSENLKSIPLGAGSIVEGVENAWILCSQEENNQIIITLYIQEPQAHNDEDISHGETKLQPTNDILKAFNIGFTSLQNHEYQYSLKEVSSIYKDLIKLWNIQKENSINSKLLYWMKIEKPKPKNKLLLETNLENNQKIIEENNQIFKKQSTEIIYSNTEPVVSYYKGNKYSKKILRYGHNNIMKYIIDKSIINTHNLNIVLPNGERKKAKINDEGNFIRANNIYNNINQLTRDVIIFSSLNDENKNSLSHVIASPWEFWFINMDYNLGTKTLKDCIEEINEQDFILYIKELENSKTKKY